MHNNPLRWKGFHQLFLDNVPDSKWTGTYGSEPQRPHRVCESRPDAVSLEPTSFPYLELPIAPRDISMFWSIGLEASR